MQTPVSSNWGGQKEKLVEDCCCSVTVTSNSLWPHGLQHTRLPCPSPSPGVCSNSRPLSWWCHPITSFSVAPFLPTLNLSQHQGLFQWVVSLHQMAKVLEFQLQHQSFQWIFKDDPLGWTGWISLQSKGSQESSPTQQFESINSSVLCLLCGPTFHIHTWLLEKI